MVAARAPGAEAYAVWNSGHPARPVRAASVGLALRGARCGHRTSWRIARLLSAGLLSAALLRLGGGRVVARARLEARDDLRPRSFRRASTPVRIAITMPRPRPPRRRGPGVVIASLIGVERRARNDLSP